MNETVEKETAVINTTINAPVEKVWEALTTPELIKKYFFGTHVKSDWKVGSSIIFTGEWEGKTYEDKGTIKELEPNKKLKYTYWSSMSGIEDKPENYVNITYDLTADGENTQLTITQDNIPGKEMKEHSIENWNKVANGLKKLLEK
jgi:uncharacterized protein YndB with AHSA1/START domain